MITAWANGFVSMELAGAFNLGGDIDGAYEFGIARMTNAITDARLSAVWSMVCRGAGWRLAGPAAAVHIGCSARRLGWADAGWSDRPGAGRQGITTHTSGSEDP
jgi:hypothetical protein